MFDDIVDFLAGHYSTPRELEALLIRAFHDYPKIRTRLNLAGSPHDVATHVVDMLQRAGEIKSGTQALWHLLLTAREDFGYGVQKQIDSFRAYANRENGGSSGPSNPPPDKSSSVSGPLPRGGGPLTSNKPDNLLVDRNLQDHRDTIIDRRIAIIGIVLGLVVALICGLLSFQPGAIGYQLLCRLEIVRTSPDFECSTNQSEATPQNGLLAFNSARDGANNIYVMKTDGSEAEALTTGNNADPAWSPDGKQIAFHSNLGGSSNIYVMNLDESAVKPLTDEGNNYSPSWSPDGKYIVFYEGQKDGGNIYVMNADGSGITPLTTSGADSLPAWSPDGKKIAFQSDRDGNQNIYIMNSDGSGVERLTWRGDNYSPSWSPDGKQVVFVSNRSESVKNIYVMKLDGSDPIRLTNEGENRLPSWSPDGQQIAFVSNRDEGWNIYLMSVDGSSVVNLTTEGGENPAWQPIPWNANP